MIKLVVGLGNPGRQYERTRHNAGFLFLDVLCGRYNGQWRLEPAFKSVVSEIYVASDKLLLQKPQTYMNRSGEAVARLARYYKILPEEILVIHDELDFEFGVVRLKKAGGHAGHNGLRDIMQQLGSRDFYRLRVGIGRPPAGWKVADYVLSAMSREERQELERYAEDISDCFADLVSGHLPKVMMRINERSG